MQYIVVSHNKNRKRSGVVDIVGPSLMHATMILYSVNLEVQEKTSEWLAFVPALKK